MDEFVGIFELNKARLAKGKKGEEVERLKVLYANTRLKGEARVFAEVYKLGKKELWKEFEDGLRGRFGRSLSALQAYKMLSVLRMKKTQSVGEFAQEIMRIASSSR